MLPLAVPALLVRLIPRETPAQGRISSDQQRNRSNNSQLYILYGYCGLGLLYQDSR